MDQVHNNNLSESLEVKHLVMQCKNARHDSKQVKLSNKRGIRLRKTYRMLKVYRIVIIEFKLHIWFPYDNIGMVSDSNCTLHDRIKIHMT